MHFGFRQKREPVETGLRSRCLVFAAAALLSATIATADVAHADTYSKDFFSFGTWKITLEGFGGYREFV